MLNIAEDMGGNVLCIFEAEMQLSRDYKLTRISSVSSRKGLKLVSRRKEQAQAEFAKALEQFTKVAKPYHDHFYDLGACYCCQKAADKAEAGGARKRVTAEETIAD